MKKKKSTSKRNSPVASRTRPVRKLTEQESTQKRRRTRPRPKIEVVPALDVSLPVAHAGVGHLVAETFLERNDASILDIVAPKGTQVESWCCFGRPTRGKNKDWVVVANHPDEHGRFPVPVPRTHFYVWGFGEVPADAEAGERIWRLYGHNVAFSGGGRDICWRVALRLTPRALPVRKGAKRPLPGGGTRVRKPKPVTIPVPA